MKKLIFAIILLILQNNFAFAQGGWVTSESIKPGEIVAIEGGVGSVAFLKSDKTLWLMADSFLMEDKDGEKTVLEDKNAYLMDRDVDTFSILGTNLMYVKKGELYKWQQVDDLKNIVNQLAVKVDDNVKQCLIGGDGFINTFFLVLKNDNSLWGWGSNNYQQLGTDTEIPFVEKPVRIAQDVETTNAGSDSTMFINKSGELFVLGNNAFQKIASEGEPGNISKPVKLLDSTSKVSTSDFISCAVGSNGKLNVWGMDFLGDNKTFPITPLMDNVEKAVSTEFGYSILKNDGTLYFLPMDALMGSKSSQNADITSIMKKVADKSTYVSAGGSIYYTISDKGIVNAWWYDSDKKIIITKNVFQYNNNAKIWYIVGGGVVLIGVAVMLLKKKKRVK